MNATSRSNPSSTDPGYRRYLKSVRANLNFWDSRLSGKKDREIIDSLYEFSTVCRAIRMGVNFPETTEMATTLAINAFRFAELAGKHSEWCFVLVEARESLTDVSISSQFHMTSHLGQFYKMTGDLTRAVVEFKHALHSANRLERESLATGIRINIASCHIEQNQFAEAAGWLMPLKERLSESLLPRRAKISAFANIARIEAYHFGSIEEAQGWFERALALCDESIPALERFRVLRGMGEMYNSAAGNPTQALEYLCSAEKILATLPNMIIERSHLKQSIGNVFFLQEKYAEALASYLAIPLDKLEQLGHVYLQASTHNNLGNAYIKTGDLDEVENHLQRSMALWKQIKNKTQYANSLGSLGEFYLAKGKDEEGIKCLAEAIQVLSKVPQQYHVPRWIREFQRLEEQARKRLQEKHSAA